MGKGKEEEKRENRASTHPVWGEIKTKTASQMGHLTLRHDMPGNLKEWKTPRKTSRRQKGSLYPREGLLPTRSPRETHKTS